MVGLMASGLPLDLSDQVAGGGALAPGPVRGARQGLCTSQREVLPLFAFLICGQKSFLILKNVLVMRPQHCRLRLRFPISRNLPEASWARPPVLPWPLALPTCACLLAGPAHRWF